MYSAFRSPEASGPKVKGEARKGEGVGKSETSNPPSFEAPLRPKRQQVARACDSEIDRLKQKVKELEEQLGKERTKSALVSTSAPAQPFALTPPSSDSTPTPDSTCVSHHVVGRGQTVWGGVMTSTGQSPRKTWYGPSSLFYFINRMNTYLSAIFQQLHPDDLIQLKSVAKTFATPDCNLADDEDKADARDASQPVSNEAYLTPTQEEYFLNLYWQSYHPTLAILDEADFKKHYRSLATKPGQPRKPSPLVDIVIAVNMQVGMAVAQRNSARALPVTEEAPTLMTVQCHILSAMYTCFAGFQNMCHVALSLAVRSAHMIGLHTEPPSDLPFASQELRRRVWWTLYTFESKVCMKLGRPFYTDTDPTSCDLPAHDHEAASLAGSDFAHLDENATWLTFTLYQVKLAQAARKVHTAFYDKYSDFYDGNTGQVIYDDPAALERYAEFLPTVMKPLDDWAESVPNSLRIKRSGDGRPFSTDRSSIVVEQFVPPWLQRQRLLLELLFHVNKSNLYRPFVCFPSTATESTPLGNMCLSHAASAAEHSVTLTRIFHHVVTNTDLLVGWHEPFQWQWNGALMLAGYLFACPTSDIAPSVREAIDLSIAVFEDFGRSFGTSLGAATLMRDLAIKIDFLAELMRGSNPQATTLPSVPEPATEQFATGAEVVPSANDIPFTQDLFAGSMDMKMAYSVDNSGDLDMLWPPIGNVSDQWWLYTQPSGPNGFGGPFVG
ncbi:hypothetical protein EKO27_g8669 [Xylaria grammica]|uniref:Xylanolytic transcriptional activator regulatory domain-containing protein n=1 Tax=Xylaria grammica TaxID=363999 RepID=A0A439CWL5_9PEZI|nr:hypothetical protein EKO27_g8669 [Xylaria grammica]